MSRPSSVDEYLAGLPADQRAALGRLRATVARLVPQAEEAISYGMPAFKLDGRGLVWFAGWKSHCSIYPLTDDFLASHADALKPYRRTRGSLHFTVDAPLPNSLVKELVLARLAAIPGTGEISDGQAPRARTSPPTS